MYLIPHSENSNWFVNGFTDSDFDLLGWRHMYTAQMLHRDPQYLPFEIVTERPLDRYVFPIRIDSLYRREDSNTNNFLNQLTLYIPDDVLADIHSNRCKILFDGSIENHNVVSSPRWLNINEIVNRTIDYYQLTKTDAVLITGNYKTVNSNSYSVAIKNWSDNLIQPCNNNFFLRQQHLIVNKLIRPKKILTFMRKERHFRVRLAHYIYKNNLRNDNIVTLGRNINPVMWNHVESNYPQWEEFLNTLPWHHDTALTSDGSLAVLLASTSAEQQAYLDTYINSVAETYISSGPDELDISEKTFKPIAYLQPFFVFAQPGTLDYLHQQGYKTFGQWWDESYDNIRDTSIKFSMLTDLYKKLSRTSHSELADMLYNMWPILEHNHAVYQQHIESGESYQHLLKTVSECFDK